MSRGPRQPPQPYQASSNRQILDAETQEDRHARLGQLFSSISKPSDQARGGSVIGGGGLVPNGRSPYAIPPSDALARAKTFLPLFQSSNAELLARAKNDPNGVNIEHTEGDEQVVAMDLGLGVYDVHGEARGDTGPEISRGRVDDEQETDDEDDLDAAHLPVRIVDSGQEDVHHDEPDIDDPVDGDEAIIATQFLGEAVDPDLDESIEGDEAIIATPFVEETMDDDEVASLPPMVVDDRNPTPDDAQEAADFATSGVLETDEQDHEVEEPIVDPVADSDSDIDHYSQDSADFEDQDSDSQDYSSMSEDYEDDGDEEIYDSD